MSSELERVSSILRTLLAVTVGSEAILKTPNERATDSSTVQFTTVTVQGTMARGERRREDEGRMGVCRGGPDGPIDSLAIIFR